MNDSIKQLLEELIAKVESEHEYITHGQKSQASNSRAFLRRDIANASLFKWVKSLNILSAEHDNDTSCRKNEFDTSDTVVRDSFCETNGNATPEGCNEETSVASTGTLLNSEDTEEPLSEDARNLLFSHFPKYLGTKFRFKVGELVYLQWRGELCLVTINFASQKLVACSGTFRDLIYHMPTTDNSFVEKDDTDDGEKYVSEYNRNTILDCSKIPGIRRTVWLQDNNEELFTDLDSHNLYSRVNALKPIMLSFTNDEDYDYKFPKEDLEAMLDSEARKMVIRYYFVPIYFVTFPGYKRKCAKTFRFWVKEKDLIKLNSVDWNVKNSKKPEINLNSEAGKTKMDRIWCKREIQSVNEYVYSIKHNRYHYDTVSGFFSAGDEITGDIYLPWVVPKSLRRMVHEHYKLVSEASIKLMDESPLRLEKLFSTAPLTSRLSSQLIVQNFKYIILLIANLIKRTHEFIAKGDGTGRTANNTGDALGSELECDELSIPSLKLLDFLETATDETLNFQKFCDIYVNNLYWVDFYLHWMDSNFANKCCFNINEYTFVTQIGNERKKPLSHILGLEYFARLFCFDVFYKTCMERIEKNGKPYLAYIPITQLLVQYLVFIEHDYCQSQEYGIN